MNSVHQPLPLKTSKIIARQNVWPIINGIILPLVLIFGTLGYLQVEARTSFFSDDFGDVAQLCLESTSTVVTPIKNFKIMEYNKSRGYAKIHCFFEDKDENRELELSKRNEEAQWEIIVSNKLDQQRTLYWPVYR